MTTQGQPEVSRRPDASMSLLNDLVANAAEQEYAQVAARRGSAPPRGRGRVLLLGGVALVGLLLVVAASQVRDRAPAAAATRQGLVGEIEQRTAATDDLQGELAQLRGAVEEAQRAQLQATDAGEAASQRLDRLGLAVGVTPVSGPGVRVVVDDAPADVARGDGGVAAFEEGRILDYDMQRLVNGLWAAGAEAVSVDGQRLTTLSAIRSAGEAILVDYRPLSPPYEVRALGDPRRLEPAFVDEPVGRYFRTLEEAYGIRFDVSTEEELVVPGASTVTLRYARVGVGSR